MPADQPRGHHRLPRLDHDRTGLRVTAGLDTGTDPTGVAIADAEMAALPLTRHAFHGDWNYVLHLQPAPTVARARDPQSPEPRWSPDLLSDPALIGMTRQEMDGLVQALAPDGYAKRGWPPRLAFPDQVLATILHLRVNLAAEPLAVLFDSSRTAMHRTLLKIRRRLDARGIVVTPAATPPAALKTLQPPATSNQRVNDRQALSPLTACPKRLV